MCVHTVTSILKQGSFVKNHYSDFITFMMLSRLSLFIFRECFNDRVQFLEF